MLAEVSFYDPTTVGLVCLVIIAFVSWHRFIKARRGGGHLPPIKDPRPHRPPPKPSDARESAVPPGTPRQGFMCECNDFSCTAKLPLDSASYMRARNRAINAAVVLPGHEDPGDLIIHVGEDYLVVVEPTIDRR